MSKLLGSLKEAIEKTGLKDGMTISFHHHMRNGDYVLNMVLAQAAEMGIKNLTVNASSIFDIHEPLSDTSKAVLSLAWSATTWAARWEKPSPGESWKSP